MDRATFIAVANAQVCCDAHLANAIRATKGADSEMPAIEEAVRVKKLNALYVLSGDARKGLSGAFEAIDRKHHGPKGISREEYHRQIEDAICDYIQSPL